MCLSQTPDDLARLQRAWTLPTLTKRLVRGGTPPMAKLNIQIFQGSSKVKVEQRADAASAFGKGATTTMPFSKFAAALKGGATHLYLSTQDVAVADDGLPQLLSPMMQKLQGDFPVVPAMMGALVPHAVNLWIGCAPQGCYHGETRLLICCVFWKYMSVLMLPSACLGVWTLSSAGSTSGLHHDYHDNLYVLLQGTKRFRLYPPAMAPTMYTHGDIKVVAPNGLICYKQQAAMEDDGTDSRVVAAWEQRRRVEREHATAERIVAASPTPSKVVVKRVAACFNPPRSCQQFHALNHYFPRTMLFQLLLLLFTQAAVQRLRAAEAALEAVLEGQLDTPMDTTSPAEPLSFSAVDLSLPDRTLRSRFPRFPGASAALEVTLSAGQALYLPAGWFHEVTSTGDDKGGLHMALNYWLYPPDALRDGDGKHPYKCVWGCT